MQEQRTASASVFAIVSTLCVVVFIIIIVLIIAIKMKKLARVIELAMQRRRATYTVPRYDEVDCQLSREARTANCAYNEVDCNNFIVNHQRRLLF